MNNFVLIFLLLVLGMVMRHFRVLPKDAAHTLNLFVIYVSLPALILLQVPKLSVSSAIFVPLFMPWVMVAVSVALVLLLARIWRWEREILGTLLLLVPLGNTCFVGFPMVETFLGRDALPYAIFYDEFGSFLALATYGSVILAMFGGGVEKPSLRQIAGKILTFPPFLVLMVALVIRGWTYPGALVFVLEKTASTLVPLVMVAIGLQIKPRLSPGSMSPLAQGLGVKMIAAPLIALGVCRLLGWDNLAAQTAVFEAGMPPMVTAGALALLAGFKPDLTAAMIGAGILLSFLTLPLLKLLL